MAAPGSGSADRAPEPGPAAWVRLLADEVGPRRPTGAAERLAAERVRGRLAEAGLEGRLEGFRGYSTFAAPYGIGLGLALAPSLLPRRRRSLRSLLAAAGAAVLATEGGLRWTPVSELLSRRPSQNLVATIEPGGDAERTVCLMCHLDTSRSGLLFHPRFVPWLNRWLQVQSVAALVQGGELVLARSRRGLALLRACRALLGAGAGQLLERELRGEDVPGANDNASGVGVVAELALELNQERPSSTRVVVLMSGCEESGLLGTQAFLRSRDTSGWLFLNFDNVGGRRPGDAGPPAPLHYLPREGQRWEADGALIGLADRIRAERPEIGLERAEGPIGLTYDASPVLARGGRALTFVAAGGDGSIPNYHWPSDTSEHVDPAALGRALELGRALVAAIDRGEADRRD